jgi:type IX secretion system PorP/SprF family membrane protein
MKEIKNLIMGSLLLFSSVLFSQQESIFTMYRYNMNIVNPAYVGVDSETLATGSIRSQWTGIKDSPETQTLSFGTVIGKNLGIGVSMVNDKTFIEKQTALGIDFSYKLIMNNNTDLYLGLKAGGNFYDINTSGLQTYNQLVDPDLKSINNFNPNVGSGILLKNKKYFVSLSVPRILNTERAKRNEGFVTVASDRPHFYLSGGYDIQLDYAQSIVFKPSIMGRYVKNAPTSIDFNALFQFHENFEIGLLYRSTQAFGSMIDFNIKKRVLLGFAYEVNVRRELASSRGSFEFLARFKI